MVFLLFFLMFFSVGCVGGLEENLQIAEDYINQFEKKSSEFFRNLGDSLENLVNDFLEDKDTPPEAVETDHLETVNSTDFEAIQFVSLAMKEAFIEIPITYAYEFDEAGENYLLERLNNYRKENGLLPLEWRDNLAQSSRYKSLAMLQYDYFSHDNPNFEGKPFDYLFWDVLDLKYASIGENLAFVAKQGFINRIEAEELFEGWKNSPSHNAQMLTKDHKYVGIGVVRAKETGVYYKGYKALIGTQHFGF